MSQAIQDQGFGQGELLGELRRDESFDLAVQLLELTDMRAEGTISEEEFAQWRDELLPS